MDSYSRYEDAMVAQARQLQWLEGEAGLRYLQGFFEDMDRQHKPEHRRPHEALAAIQIHTLREAEPIYASVEACELVEFAMRTFEPERALPGDPFAPSGFALLAKPLPTPDLPWTAEQPGRSPVGILPIRALSWTSIHNEDYSLGSFWIAFYVDWRDEEAQAHGADRPTADLDVWRAAHMELREPGRPHLCLAHQFQWSWGTTPWRGDVEDFEILLRPGETKELLVLRSRQQVCLIQTFWRIASQFRPAKERAPRGIWRDSNRKGVKGRDVTVIRLRRTRGPGVEPSGRQLTVQFPVRGHWRNQWYPSLGDHRQIWIAPFIKGPEGAEFVIHPRAWEFTR